ncbi:UDP-glycosyltransferase [Manduca sexta]|uniref:UDP-glucuronosyltransferase n=1 Tax=Manduca sexta TaxID=7130 RepID=A0A921YKP7_MANSE|nr:UDP-glycosyltransferase [Manduca sexta]
MRSCAKLLLLLTICASGVSTLNILGVFPFEGKTHFFVFESYLRELAKRGHNVTVISHFPQKSPLENYNDISLAGTTSLLENVFPIERSYATVIAIGFFLVNTGTANCRVLLSNKGVQNLWKTKTKFDVVVAEQFNSDCSLGLAYKLGAPVVGINTHLLLPWHYERFGIQYNPSYVSFLLLEGGTKPNIYQRLERTILYTYFNTLYKVMCQRIDQNTLAEYFDDVPPLNEIAREIKFMLTYTHFTLFGSSLLPSNVIEVNGYHVAEPRELPDDIRKFIEESQHGVIYISFGSMLKAASLPADKLNAIIEAVAEIPQRVLWKWDQKTLPGNPKNIFISNWLPQNDILAHPNVLAFFSHCGLLSTTESIHHGVPMLAMPVFGDQPGNAAAVEESGLGLQIRIAELTKEIIVKKLKTILDPKFREQVKHLSRAYRNRNVSPMDSAIFWTEYAAQHKNFTYRSRSADVPFYQYLYLDVLVILLSFVFVVLIILKTVLFAVMKCIQKSNKNKKE